MARTLRILPTIAFSLVLLVSSSSATIRIGATRLAGLETYQFSISQLDIERSIRTIRWNFGDGSPARVGIHPEHSYTGKALGHLVTVRIDYVDGSWQTGIHELIHPTKTSSDSTKSIGPDVRGILVRGSKTDKKSTLNTLELNDQSDSLSGRLVRSVDLTFTNNQAATRDGVKQISRNQLNTPTRKSTSNKRELLSPNEERTDSAPSSARISTQNALQYAKVDQDRTSQDKATSKQEKTSQSKGFRSTFLTGVEFVNTRSNFAEPFYNLGLLVSQEFPIGTKYKKAGVRFQELKPREVSG